MRGRAEQLAASVPENVFDIFTKSWNGVTFTSVAEKIAQPSGGASL